MSAMTGHLLRTAAERLADLRRYKSRPRGPIEATTTATGRPAPGLSSASDTTPTPRVTPQEMTRSMMAALEQTSLLPGRNSPRPISPSLPGEPNPRANPPRRDSMPSRKDVPGRATDRSCCHLIHWTSNPRPPKATPPPTQIRSAPSRHSQTCAGSTKYHTNPRNPRLSTIREAAMARRERADIGVPP